MTSLLLLLFFLVVLIFWISSYRFKWRPKKFPPGPVMGLLGRDRPKESLELRAKYGDIFGLACGYRGLKGAVVLSNPDDIRELFSRKESACRPRYNLFLDTTVESCNYGVVWSVGQPWMEYRGFSFRVLRELARGKRPIENITLAEVRDLLGKLKEVGAGGKPLQTTGLFSLATFNVIWSIVAGVRYGYDDPELTEILRLFHAFSQAVSGLSTCFFVTFPSLAKLKHKIPPWLLPKSSADILREKLFQFIRKEIREHERTRVKGFTRDLIDTYLDEVIGTTDPSSSFYACKQAGDTPLVVLLFDMFLGGTETVSRTLEWAFFLLALNPGVQDKAHKEIEQLVGNREIVLVDRPYLPYVNATILEIMRVSSVLPFALLHSATEDIEFKGYIIPEGTTLMPNLYAAHFDRSSWGDPENFRPERFLSADEKTVIRSKAWMPYGAGKRQCPGASIATDQLFLFISNLVRSLEIRMPADEPEHMLDGVDGGTRSPPSHRIIVKVRENHDFEQIR